MHAARAGARQPAVTGAAAAPRWRRAAARPPRQRRGLSDEALSRVRDTLPAIAKVNVALTSHFYKRLFAAHPELLNTFNVTNQNRGQQPRALFSAFSASALNLLETGKLPTEMLESIHHKHCALNVQPAQYTAVGEHMLATIKDMLAPDEKTLEAWAELYGVLALHCIAREEELYAEAEAKPGGWRGERDFVLSGKLVKSKTVIEFTFSPMDGGPVCDFKPGQYTTVWVHPAASEYRQPRHYSLCTVPSGRDLVIAVKRCAQGGLVSGHLHDDAAVGDRVSLSPPFGNYHIRNVGELWTGESPTIVLLSAGVGITPTLSLLGHMKEQQNPVLWLHAAKNGGEHPFRDYLVSLAQSRAARGGFTRRVWYTDPEPEDNQGDSNDSPFHFHGYMDLSHVRSLLPLKERHARYYFCGPLPWMRSISRQLCGLGVDPKCLNFEVLGPMPGAMDFFWRPELDERDEVDELRCA